MWRSRIQPGRCAVNVASGLPSMAFLRASSKQKLPLSRSSPPFASKLSVFFTQKQLLIKQRKEAEAAALAAKEQQMTEQRKQIVKAKATALKLATAATSKARAFTIFPNAQAQSRVCCGRTYLHNAMRG